jgi:hypothetical protein
MEPGWIVLVNCVSPKEQIWGVLVGLGPAGVTIRGIELRSFEDWMRQATRPANERALGLVTMFIPLFRVERMFRDERAGQVPSYCEQFREHVGRSVEEFLGVEELGPGPDSEEATH